MNARALTFLPALVLSATAFGQACTATTTTSGDAGSSGSSGDGGVGEAGSPCILGEPNDTRDQAFAITLGTSYTACLGSATDKDFYSFTAPADAEGGYVVAELTNVGQGWIKGSFMTTTDNTNVYNDQSAGAGASLKLYIAVASGTKYDFIVEHYVGEEIYNYDMKLTYTKFADPSLPSRAKATAPALTLAAASPGLFSASYKAGTIPETDYERYYKVDLAAGKATVKLDNVASDFWAKVRVVDGANAEVGNTSAANVGASISTDVTIATAGTYYIIPGVYVNPPKAVGTGNPPDSFTRNFTVTVTQ